jgi:hypothetical protein
MAIRRRAANHQNRRGRQAGQVSSAGHAVRAGADLFGSTTGAIEELWRSGFGMTSHFAERSSSHIARSIGLTDEQGQQATEQSSRNIDAIVQSSMAYADAIQNISRELSSFCRERLDSNLEKMNALMRSRTPQELIAAQSDLLRDNLEGILKSSRRLADASVGIADGATRRLTKIMKKQRRAA